MKFYETYDTILIGPRGIDGEINEVNGVWRNYGKSKSSQVYLGRI